MSELVDVDAIEGLVGAERHQTRHIGRSINHALYIMHSRACVNVGIDLRECKYSLAMDRGVDFVAIHPHYLKLARGRLRLDGPVS